MHKSTKRLPITRRHTLVLLGAAGLTLWSARFSPLMASETGDAEFVGSLSDQLSSILNSSSSLDEKRRKVVPLIDQNVDVNGIARFCLGRYWRIATPEQQQKFLSLFHSYLVNAITGKLGQYEGVHVDIGKAVPHGNDQTAVLTTLSRAGQPSTTVQWVIDHVSGAPKVSDVIGEGVSLSITQRGDYSSYLQRNNGDIGALLGAMERQASHGA